MRVFIAIILTEKMKYALGNVIHDMKKVGAEGILRFRTTCISHLHSSEKCRCDRN